MTLAEEAQRYLAAIEFFRAAGSEPHWRRETPVERAQLSNASPTASTHIRERKKSCPN